MTSIAANGTNGVLVTWGSATKKLYSLQRTSSLLLPFNDLTQHILSTPPENTYLDSSVTNGTLFFYRVKHAIPAFIEERNDGIVGLSLLISGFGGQLASQWLDPGLEVLMMGLAVLALILGAYFIFRNVLIQKGTDPVEKFLAKSEADAMEPR